jgi:hypothetical protein
VQVAGNVPFASPEDQQYLVDRLQRDIDNSRNLLDRYRFNLKGCL